MFKNRKRNKFLPHQHYRVYKKLLKGDCSIYQITCASPSCIVKLDKELFPNYVPSLQPIYNHVENCYHNKLIGHLNDWIIMAFLNNKTPQHELDKIHASVIFITIKNK